MANIPISDLPAATSLNTTDLCALVQSGVTKRMTYGDIITTMTGFTQSGTGAVARTVQARMRDWVSVKDFGATGDGATNDTTYILAAIAAVNAAGGGTIFFPPGRYRVNATLAFSTASQAITIQGSGASSAGTTLGTTTIQWIGGADELITIGADVRNFVIRDLNLDNSGTATIAIQVTAADYFKAENVMIRPQTGFSDTAIDIGPSGSAVVSAQLVNVQSRGSNRNLRLSHAYAFEARNFRSIAATGTEGVTIGLTSTTDVVSAKFFGGSIESSQNIDGALVNRVWSLQFYGTYFESGGTGFAISIASTVASSISVDGGYFMGTVGSAAASAIEVNSSAAELTVAKSFFLSFSAGGTAITNTSSQVIRAICNDVAISGGDVISSYTNGTVTTLGNTVAGVAVVDRVGSIKVGGGTAISGYLASSAVWDPGNLADGATAATSVTVTGAAVGDMVICGFPMLVGTVEKTGFQISGSVTSANTVRVTVTNHSGGALDLDSGTLKVAVFQ